MSYDKNANNAMNLLCFGEKFIKEDIKSLVESNPYLAFFVLSAAIEFIARCRCCLTDFHYGERNGKRYLDAIDEIEALRPYRKFKKKKGKGYTNTLYSSIRCGLLHSSMPNSGIILSSEENELDRNVIGCKSLYSDIKRAWEEIKSDPTIHDYLIDQKALVIINNHCM